MGRHKKELSPNTKGNDNPIGRCVRKETNKPNSAGMNLEKRGNMCALLLLFSPLLRKH